MVSPIVIRRWFISLVGSVHPSGSGNALGKRAQTHVPMKSPMDPTPRPADSQTLRGSTMLSGRAWLAVADTLDLSKRQIQIVRAVFDDATEYAISQDLSISQHTVHTHLERIHRKLKVHGRVELVILILGEFLRLTADAATGLPPVCGRRAVGACPFQKSFPEK